MTSRARALALGALLVGLAVFDAARLEVTSDVTRFLAAPEDDRAARLTRELAASDLTRTLALTVGTAAEPQDPDLAAAAAADLASMLAGDPAVAWVVSGTRPELERAVWELYFPRRLALLSFDPEAELALRLSDTGLADAARALKRELDLPTAPLVKRLAAEDPLLAFPALLERFEALESGSLRPRGGALVTADGRAALFVGTRASPFDTASAGPLLERIAARVQAFAAGQRPLVVERSGAHPFAVAGERAIRADVTRISILSTLGVVLLYLLVVRSWRALLLSLVPPLAGLVVATAGAIVVAGRLHALTVAFGSTLIGVAIDSPTHLVVHHALTPEPDGPEGTARALWPALVLCALTTIVGLAGLAWTSMPGLREVALFTSVGIVTALLTTRFVVAPLLGSGPAPPALVRAASLSTRLLAAARARRGLLVAPALAALATCAVGLPRVRWADDPAALQRPPGDLLEEDARVRARVARVDGGRLVVARGADVEAALVAGERAVARLEPLVAKGALEGLRSVRSLLPSRALQARNLATLGASPDLGARLDAAFAAQGFRRGSFAPFARALEAPPPSPLDLPALEASPLGDLVRPFVSRPASEGGAGKGTPRRPEAHDAPPGVEDEAGRGATKGSPEAPPEPGDVLVFVFLRGVKEPDALRAALADLPDVELFDQRAWLAAAYGTYRRHVLELVPVGLLLVLLLVLARHRDLRRALAAAAPALLAAPTAVALLALCGVELTLLHLVSLVLVLALGVDQGVFLAERRAQEGLLHVGPSIVGMALACALTILALGLLALSEAAPLRAIGLTTGLGVLLSLLLAPLALVLAEPQVPGGDGGRQTTTTDA